LSALLFLNREVVDMDIPWMGGNVRRNAPTLGSGFQLVALDVTPLIFQLIEIKVKNYKF
jgi:hypothetical protein